MSTKHSQSGPSEVSDSTNSPQPLGTLARGATGRVMTITADSTVDLERELLEIGFVEGAWVELLHQGPFGEPVAVRIDQRLTIALRRKEANAILVTPHA